NDPVVDATQFTARVMDLTGTTITGTQTRGAVRLDGAHLGMLQCAGARLNNTAGPALFAQNLKVDQNVFLRAGFTATGTDGAGTVHMPGARIGGRFGLRTDHINQAAGDRQALVNLDGLTYSGLPIPESLTYWLSLLRDHMPA